VTPKPKKKATEEIYVRVDEDTYDELCRRALASDRSICRVAAEIITRECVTRKADGAKPQPR
jgi:hypothetical protein